MKTNYRILVAALAVVSVTAHAGTTAGELIDIDAQTTKSTMLSALAKAQASAGGAGVANQGGFPTGPVAPSSGPVGDAPKSTPPATTAVYGLDASAIGMKPSLRSLVRWNGIVYPAYRGATIRGYKVVAVTVEGTTLEKGRERVFAETEIDDGKAVESAADPRKALAQRSPLPPQAVASGMPVPPAAAQGEQTPPVFLPVPMQAQAQQQAREQ
ncbi:putative Type IV pilus biogenesis protein PilP (plasmid) [Pararobbsia alpina]|uniref:hypothetical protein n=1 Tax=Pararobbsia alpina TaxID=621374 RepID=UPI0039A62B05